MEEAILALGGTAQQRMAFMEPNREFYQSVDWALDISEVECELLDLRDVPAGLVRRDSQSQAVVRRSNVMSVDWEALGIGNTYWPEVIEMMLKRGWPDTVLVAPRRDARYPAMLDGIRKLRDLGIADSQ